MALPRTKVQVSLYRRSSIPSSSIPVYQIILTTWLAIILSAYPIQSASSASNPVAVIDGVPLSEEAFKAKMARRPNTVSTPQEKKALLNEMVNFELLYRAALGKGYDKDPAIQERLKRLIVEKYYKKALEPKLAKITVSDEEIEQFYQNHKADFLVPRMVRAAVIRITVPAGGSTDNKAQLRLRAEAARSEALKLNPATKSFGPVAVKYSDHQSTRYRGGDSGWFQANRHTNRWPKQVHEAVFNLKKPNDISRIITASSGFFLVKIMAIKESAPRSLLAVKDQIRRRLFTLKKVRVEREFFNELRGKFPVEVFYNRLEAIDSSGGAPKSLKKPPALPGK